ncbi:molybdopterin dehydrogenase [Verticiella sediminum]|uniref:Molybdopterin dehydrogenase n=1 Tax=Verticiella sediminum TaxID=1247510 RepID=A0A556AYQ7_9BURK|nr:FAD binding domain-containing protein [Verticiella sediminum]TSH98071.1 molybdopterin dehydrogenase [Verticiella sediminum]
MQVVTPATPQLAQALADRLGGRARYIAGGTRIQQEWPEPHQAPDDTCFIDVRACLGANDVRLTGDALRIGAGTTLEAARAHPLVLRHAPLLATALGQVAAPGVRHLGTLGGNVAWGAGDSMPALLVLDALAELADGRCIPLAQLHACEPVPLLLAVRLAQHGGQAPRPRAVYEKIGLRAAFSPARLSIALRWAVCEDAGAPVRIAACAPGVRGHRLHAAETVLRQDAVDRRGRLALLREACARSLPGDLATLASRLVAGHCGFL